MGKEARQCSESKLDYSICMYICPCNFSLKSPCHGDCSFPCEFMQRPIWNARRWRRSGAYIRAFPAVLLCWVPFWHRLRQHHLHSLLSCHRLFDLLFGSVLLFLFMIGFLQLLLWSLLIARKEKMYVLLVMDRFLLVLNLINIILSSLPIAQTTAWTPLSSRGYAPFLLCSC